MAQNPSGDPDLSRIGCSALQEIEQIARTARDLGFDLWVAGANKCVDGEYAAQVNRIGARSAVMS